MSRRLDLAEDGVVKTKPLHHPWTEVLDENVGVGGEPTHRCDGSIAFEVEHDAFLAGVELAEVAAGAVAQWQSRAHHIACRRLDLDHLGTEVRHEACAVRAGNGGREIEHAQARVCFHHLASLPTCLRAEGSLVCSLRASDEWEMAGAVQIEAWPPIRSARPAAAPNLFG